MVGIPGIPEKLRCYSFHPVILICLDLFRALPVVRCNEPCEFEMIFASENVARDAGRISCRKQRRCSLAEHRLRLEVDGA